MYRIIFLIKITLLIAASATLVMCSTSGNNGIEEENEYMLRVKNATATDTTDNNLIYGDIYVRLIPDKKNPDFKGNSSIIEFEKLQLGRTSKYQMVPNIFAIEVNGELIGDGLEFFGLDDQPNGKWLIEINSKYDNGNRDYQYGLHMYRVDL